jgi:hypothetical protein
LVAHSGQRSTEQVGKRSVCAGLESLPYSIMSTVGCNIGPQRMAVASGLSLEEISLVADWYLSLRFN